MTPFTRSSGVSQQSCPMDSQFDDTFPKIVLR
jgi:hypothetical protein